jgi:hypothetical protein
MGEGRGGKAGGWPRGEGETSENGMCLLDIGQDACVVYEEEDACVSCGMCLLGIGAQCWKGLHMRRRMHVCHMECACSTLARNVGRACEHRPRHSFACFSFASSASSSSMSAPACLGPTHPALPTSAPHTCTPGRGRTPPPRTRIHAHKRRDPTKYRQSVSHACPCRAALGAAPSVGFKFRG